MKKIFGIITLILVFTNIGFADSFKIGQKIENEFRFSKKVTFPLKTGEWEIIDRKFWFYGPIKVRLITLALIENNELVAMREFQEGNLSGGYQSILDMAMVEWLYKDKYDGCYERLEYTLVKKYHKGNTHNCLLINHIETSKVLYNPDDPDMYLQRKNIRSYLRDNNIEYPKIMLASWHAYFSRRVSNHFYQTSYFEIPQRLGGPENNFDSEETSEYHPLNINKYPKHKKYMDKFIEISSLRHMEFEKKVNAIKGHKLKFTNINSDKVQDDKILDQLKQLDTLYKEGILTKEEFSKAKKKILN
jgi:hypothetical protein